MKYEDRYQNGAHEPNGHATRYDSRDPDEVQRALEETRRRIDSTVDQIEHRLSPGQMVDQALSYVKSGPGEFGANLSRTVKDNPIPVVLVGVGLAWLAMSQGRDEQDMIARRMRRRERKERARQAMHGARDRLSGVGDRVSHLGDKVSNLGERTKDGLVHAKDRVTDMVGSGDHDRSSSAGVQGYEGYRDYDDYGAESESSLRSGVRQARRRTRRATRSAWQQLNDNPIILGALGIVVGALMGGVAPATSTENRLLGDTSDDVKRRGRRVARRAGTVARETASDVAETTKHAAREAAQDVKQSAKQTASSSIEREKNQELGASSAQTPHSPLATGPSTYNRGSYGGGSSGSGGTNV